MKKHSRALTAVLTAAACGTSAAALGPSSIAGRYILRDTDGSTLPFATINSAARRLYVVAGEFTLVGDGSMTTRIEYRVEQRGAAVSSSVTTGSGTYNVSGSSVSMTTVSVSNGVSSLSTTFDGIIAADGAMLLDRIAGRSDGLTYRYNR